MRTIMHRKWFQECKNLSHYHEASIIHLQFTTLTCLYLHTFSTFARVSLIAFEIPARLPKQLVTFPFLCSLPLLLIPKPVTHLLFLLLSFQAFAEEFLSGNSWGHTLFPHTDWCCEAPAKLNWKQQEKQVRITQAFLIRKFLEYCLGRSNYPCL